jgi:hypothetical protein
MWNNFSERVLETKVVSAQAIALLNERNEVDICGAAWMPAFS